MHSCAPFGVHPCKLYYCLHKSDWTRALVLLQMLLQEFSSLLASLLLTPSLSGLTDSLVLYSNAEHTTPTRWLALLHAMLLAHSAASVYFISPTNRRRSYAIRLVELEHRSWTLRITWIRIIVSVLCQRGTTPTWGANQCTICMCLLRSSECT